jgi:tetratricopeptide (TPR) repeat protein
MKWTKMFSAAAAAAAALWIAPAFAQQTASLHGHVIYATGDPLSKGDVELTKDKDVPRKEMKFQYTFPLDANGNYKGADIAPGDYFAYVIAEGKDVDRLPVTLKAGDDKTLDDDMTRPEYLKALTPEERKGIEDYKKKNQAAVADNKVISNLNATLTGVRADLAKNGPTYGDVTDDVTKMKQAVDARPNESVLWITYGRALETQGEHLAHADREAHKPVSSDDDAMKAFSDAVDAYKKGIDLNAATKKPNPADQAAAWNSIGNIYAKQGKLPEASDAFESAVKLAPTSAGMFYGNEAAVMFNAGQTDGALAAANKAIAADPNRPDPYFVKGQALIAKSTFDAKTQKIVAPPGCVDAYQKYLQLAPDGAHADSVREVLTSLGEKVDTHYKAGKH